MKRRDEGMTCKGADSGVEREKRASDDVGIADDARGGSGQANPSQTPLLLQPSFNFLTSLVAHGTVAPAPAPNCPTNPADLGLGKAARVTDRRSGHLPSSSTMALVSDLAGVRSGEPKSVRVCSGRGADSFGSGEAGAVASSGVEGERSSSGEVGGGSMRPVRQSRRAGPVTDHSTARWRTL